jgi:hypothetical protein
MDTKLEMRVARVIARRLQVKASLGQDEPSAARRRASSHDQIVGAIPLLASNISNAVGDLNDRLSDAGIWVLMERAMSTPVTEARFAFRLVNADADEPQLDLSVDAEGTVRAVLVTKTTRSLVGSTTIFDADQSRLVSMLLTLLEAHYH